MVYQECGSDSFMIQDGVCDDMTNHEACLFDGGDCCGDYVVTSVCVECICYQNGL